MMQIDAPVTTMNNQHTHVMLANEHAIIAKGLASILAEGNYAFHIRCTINTADQIIPKFNEHLPQVLIMDVRFNGDNIGLEIAKEILNENKDAKIIFISELKFDNLIDKAYALGAKAYLTENCTPAELYTAIDTALNGEIYFMPSIAAHMARVKYVKDNNPETVLTEKEMQVFLCMAVGSTIDEIVANLNLSKKTIANQSKSIKAKLGCDRITDVTRLAIRFGLIEP